MKITPRLIVVLALVSLSISLFALYLNASDYSEIQQSSSVQFDVGVTVRPSKTQPPPPRKRNAFADFFNRLFGR